MKFENPTSCMSLAKMREAESVQTSRTPAKCERHDASLSEIGSAWDMNWKENNDVASAETTI